MKILASPQLKALDAHTVRKQKLDSKDLIYRAALQFAQYLAEQQDKLGRVLVFCGKGNNGADGAVIAVILKEFKINVEVYVVEHTTQSSPEFEYLSKPLAGQANIIKTPQQIPAIKKNDIVIDAILGTGLNRPATGIAAAVIKNINKSGAKIYSVDIPSGLYAHVPNKKTDAVVCATKVVTFHAPKLSFLFAENGQYVPEFTIRNIDLDKAFAEKQNSPYYYLQKEDVRAFFKPRKKFSHKGSFGHALIAAGSTGKNGAAVLAVSAALRSGAGLVSSLIPASGYTIMQRTNPEAMVQRGGDAELQKQIDYSPFTAIAVGLGIGVTKHTTDFLGKFLKQCKAPLVLDADALNIVAANKKLLKLIPPNTVLTPHPGEFKRLVGHWKNDLEKIEKQVAFSKKHKVVVVLKGAHTSVSAPDGKVYFNSTGNAGMAKGGSGDVLTGVIGSLLAQGYSPLQAAQLGVYVHGLAGDMAYEEMGATSMKAGDIVSHLSNAFKTLEKAG